jgi:DNA repair exonuclease SbcCD ATPase subunit
MKYAASYFLTAALFSLAIATQLNAQVVGQPYRLNDKEVGRMIKQIEDQTKTFRKSLDSALDHSRLNSTRRENDINAFVKQFEEQTKRLHDRFDDHKSVAADVEAVLDRAAAIDGFMSRQRLSGRAEEDWFALRSRLDELAQAYNVSWRWGGPVSLADGGVSTVPYGNAVPYGGAPYRLSDKEVERILRSIEQQAKRFRSSLDSALDKSRLNGTRREDDVNEFIQQFDDEVKRLRDRFSEHKSVAADVQSVLDRAARIDDFMSRRDLSRKSEDEWSRLRANLDELARAYSVDWRWQG